MKQNQLLIALLAAGGAYLLLQNQKQPQAPAQQPYRQPVAPPQIVYQQAPPPQQSGNFWGNLLAAGTAITGVVSAGASTWQTIKGSSSGGGNFAPETTSMYPTLTY